MTTAKRFNDASGMLFFGGFMSSKLQYLPYPLVSAIFRFISLGFYLAGYGTWFTASYHEKGYKNHEDKWYGFAKLKEQYQLSSVVGLAATVLSIAAIFVPVLFPPAAWLYALGNVIWGISEYHKFKNPPKDEEYSQSRQEIFLSYVATTTAISIVTAIAATLIFLFPPLAVSLTAFSLLVCVGLGVLSAEFWLTANYGDHKPLKVEHSYNKLGPNDPSPAPQNKPENDPEPAQTKAIFAAPNEVPAAPSATAAPKQEDSQEPRSTI